MRPRILAGLILCNLVWSAHPAMGKLVLEDFGPVYASWLRYSGALISYVAVVTFLRFRLGWRKTLPAPFLVPEGSRRMRQWALLAALGFMTFCFSPLTQMTGLLASRATDSALIVAMEPIMTVALAWIFIGERPTLAHVLAFIASLGGFALLTELTPARLESGWDPRMVGNLILLVSLIGEASYSTIGKKLMLRYPPMAIFGSALALGTVFLTIVAVLYALSPNAEAFGTITWKSALGLLWLGPLGTSAAYLVWMLALAEATVPSLAVTLFLQPLFGALWGYLFLGDRLSAVQALGGAVILLALAAQILNTMRRKKIT